MRYIFLLSFLISFSFAFSINDSLLKIHAVLLPKIYLMDYNFKNKIKDNTITIAILYDANSYRNAVSLDEKIKDRYKNKIQDYNVKTVLLPYNKVSTFNANLYYLFPSNIKNIKRTVKKAKEVKALTFSYLNNDLKDGIVLSLEIGKKVKPIINLNAAKSADITFRPVLLKISNIYTSKDNNTFSVGNKL